MTDPRTHPDRHPVPPALRTTPWHGRRDIAVLAPVPGRVPTTTDVVAAVTVLADSGVAEVFTPALGPEEQSPFTGAGFGHLEHLHLLRHDLDALPPRSTAPLRRGWRGDYPAVLALDAEAFDRFWRFDRQALSEARAATPTGRFRVSPAQGRGISGYAVTGAGHPMAPHGGTPVGGRRRTAYLQRLAVRPDHQGRGTGTALITDALWWARRRGATELFVNTQERNEGALRLYLRLGFTPQPHGLDVLRWAA